MADPFNPQPQRNYLDDILDQAFNDLELERQRQENIINAPDPAQRLGEIQKVEKQVENEVPEVQEAVRQKTYNDTSYYTGRPFASQQPQKQGKKRQPISEVMYNRLAQGSAELGQGLASAPGLIYGLASFPQRQLAKIPGLESLDDGTREVEEYLSLNPVAKYYKDTADKFREQNTRYDESIVDYIKQGNLVDALGLTAVEIVGSIPYTASMIAGGYAGVPAKLTVPSVGAVAGGQKNSTLLEEMPELADDRRTLNALVDGLAEGTFEQLGSAGIGRTIKSLSGDLIKQFGRENGNKILKESIAKVFSDKSSRFMVPKAMNQEGWEEFATTVMQNWNAQKTGEDPGRDLFEGAIDSYIVGAGAGGAITAPVGIAVRKQRKEAKKLEKAKKKGMEAIESGQLRQLTNDDISEFARSLSKEEAMKLGVIPDYENQSISYDPKTELGKEMIRRNLEMDKFPETETELREAGARATIKQQQMEGKDFTGALIKKVREEAPNIVVEEEYLDKTVADEAEQKGWTEEETKQVLRDHGIDEDSDPKEVTLTGTSFGGSIKISRAGTPQRMAEEYVAVQEEMAEEYYKAEQENNPEFENEIAKDRRKYHESTGEKDKGESNLEWFSTKAVHFATQGKVHQSIGAKLTEIFNRFIDNAKLILKDAIRLRKAIKEGKVSDSLLKKLEEATDFKKVGEKVQQAKESKKQPTYRTVKAEKPTFEKGSTENKLIGYRVMRYDPNTGKAISGADGRQSILPKKGEDISYGGGFYLTNDPQYATDYYAVHDNNILIKVEFDKNDLLKGSLTDREPEISVKKGKILDTQIITEEVESTSYRLSKKSGGDLVWKNTPIVKQPNLLELTKYLTERAKSIADELGVDLTQNTPEAINIVSNVIAEEIKIETGNKKNALGWYSIKMQNAIELLSQIHPEIMEDPDHNQVFKVALAITSNGTPVEDNLKIAMVAYEHWKDKGVLPSTFKVGGQEGPAMASAFKVYNKKQKEIGTTAFHTFLNTEFTIKEITDMGYKVSGELVDAKAMGAVIFGPKVGGGFLSNLNGHYQYLTMDRWFMRTMGRIRGNLKEQKDYSEQLKRFRTALRINPSKMKLYEVSKEDLKNDDKVIEVARKVLKQYAKPKYVKKENRKKSFYPKTELNKASNTLVKNIDKIYEAPANGTDRKYLREIMKMAVEKSDVEGLTMADAQAIIWFPEKRFFSKFGVGSQRGKKETDYETEARQYVKSRLGSVQPIGRSAKRNSTGIKENTQKPESLGKEKPTYRLTPTFYSKAERVVTEQFPPTMKSQSIENFLKKNQVKPEEIQWLDLETLLKGKQKVTKEELQEWIQANKVKVEDVMLGESYTLNSEQSLTKDEFLKMFVDFEGNNTLDDGETLEFIEDGTFSDFKYLNEDNKEYVVYKDNDIEKYTLRRMEVDEYSKNAFLGAIVDNKDSLNEIRQIIGSLSSDATKHSMYQLPGEKEDYRELLLTLPKRPLTSEELKYNKVEKFSTGHYDQPNILAHVRFNTRKSPTGEQVLFIEELQSDWHTKGREKGYKKSKPPGIEVEISKLMSEHQKIISKKNDIQSKNFITLFPSTDAEEKKGNKKRKLLQQEINQLEWKAETLLNKANELKNSYGKNIGVPDAPFKGNGWIELIMKRMLRYASENNFDRIAWTTSNQQIERWRSELRQNVDQISWQKLVAGRRELTSEEKIIGATTRGNPFIVEEMEELQTQDMGKQSVIVNGLKKNENVFNQTIPLEGETTINGQKVTLEGLLGKQMATQIRNSEDRTGVIEGDNLTVGGQGFKTVYDFAIKKILNKMGKKFGAKVDQVLLKTRQIEGGTDDYFADEDYQPSIPVTRKMKESALKGQPTFRASKMTSTDDVLSSPSFKKWFKGSQVKDKDGNPLVVYHGTGKSFDEFDKSKLYGDGISGFYFTPDPNLASDYAESWLKEDSDIIKTPAGGGRQLGGNVMPVYLQMNKPYYVTYEKDLMGPTPEKIRKWKSEGYDGIIDKEHSIYQVFEPTQIKSIFNKGTFNPHDPRISFRMAPTNLVTPLAKIYQEQKGNKKSYTKENFELDLVRLGYPEETIKTAMDLFGIIRIKQIATDEPTPIEKELQKLQDMHITRSNLKDRIKRAYRLGAVEKEKEITKLQKIVTNYARKNLPTGLFKKSEVTGLLAKVRDAKRARELATALERIDRVIDKVNKREALKKWNKSIKKKAKVKKVKGVTEGTVGAEVQEIVYTIRGKKKGTGYMDLSPVQVEEKIEALGKTMGESEDGEPTEEQAIELNLLLTFGAIKDKTPEEINRATEVFDDLVAEGRMQVVEDQEAYKARMKEIGDEILDVITGGAGPQTQTGAQRLGLKKEGLIAEIKEQLSTFDSHNQSLEYIFDKLSRLDKTSKPLESAINNYFMPMIRQARLAEYNGLVEMQTLIKENAEKIFKVKGKKLTTRLNQNTVDKIRINHLDGYSPETGRASGKETYSELTYNQAYKKWMELQDPTLHKTFEKMGWDVNKTKRQIEDQLPKDMIKWAEWQLYEFYPMYYHRVNKTFRQRFKVNMAFNPVYSPISRMIGARADEGDDTLNKSKSPMGSMTSAGSLKSRVSNQEELTWIDGDTTIMKHITEMEHFIYYTQVMREMRSVFMNRNISRAISTYHGNGISRTLNKFMDDIARGGVDRAQNLDWMDKLRANFSRAVIGANPVVYMKQLASIPAYMADIPTLDWTKEFVKVFNPIEFKRMYRTLSKSEMLKMRYDKGFERDMVLALQNVKPGKVITGANLFNNAMYAFTKMGDKQAIFLGGWAVYKYHFKKALKEGKSRSDAKQIAMKKFEEASLRSQQASDVEDLSDFARRGSLPKLFTMFMTSPNQYYRMVAGGYRNLYYRRGTKAENFRRIFVGQFLLPTLFQFISNGFEWDDEDQAMSLFLFPFAGLLFVGQGFEFLIRSAFNKAFPMGPVAILDFFVDWGNTLRRAFHGEGTTQEYLKILDTFLDGASKVTGVPYGPAVRTAKGIAKVAKGDAENPIREAIGFKFEEEKKKKKKKKKVTIAEPSYVY